MGPKRILGILFLLSISTAYAQTEPAQLTEVLQRQVQLHQTVAYQLQEYLFKSIPELPSPQRTAMDRTRSAPAEADPRRCCLPRLAQSLGQLRTEV